MTQLKKSNKRVGFFGVILLLIIIDQVTKHFAQIGLCNKPAFPIIPNVFELRYLENTSAAFGVDPISILNNIFHFQYFTDNPAAFLHWKMTFFTIFTIVVIVLMIILLFKIPSEKKFGWMNFILILFISGAIGNLIDRVMNHYVIDFFYFRLINFPIFNVADIYVTVGAFLLIILCLFYYKEEDFNKIFPSKEKNEKK